MKSLKLLLIVCLAATVASFSFAQGRRGMFRGSDPSGVMLLQRADVQKDLALTDEQKGKLQTAREEMMSEAREMFQNGGGSGDQEAMRANFQKLQDSMKKKVDAILTKEQTARLKQINIQISGNSIILQADIQKELDLTDAQKAKIKDLQTKQQEAMQSLREKAQNGEIEREEMTEIMAKNQKAMDTELGKVLTDANKAKLKEMSGKEFKADEDKGN